MAAFCYILFSPSKNRFYTGATQDILEQRIIKHNNHLYGTNRYTAITKDWELFLKIQVDEYAHAIRLEKHIKSMKSSTYIKNLKKYPELVEKIIKLPSS